MTRITIDVQNEEDKQLIQNLLKRLGIGSVEEAPKTSETSISNNGKEVATLMQELAGRGGLSAIKDPVAWQKEIRTDRKLPFRD